MAFDFSKLTEWLKPITGFKFSQLNSRARIIVVLAGMVGIVLLMYFIANHFFGGTTTGAATVATPPSNLKTLPGAQVTPEYARVIREVEQKRVREAELTGTSNIGNISNVGNANPSAQCNIVCSDQSVNVKNTLEDWARRAEINDDVAADLQQLANKNVSVDDYAAKLNELVKQGKLTPEQARELLAQYKKQHANALLQESAKMMDDLIKSGQLPLDVANTLLGMQKDNVTPAQYAAYLDQLVKEGKISPDVAKQLLAQYTQQHTRQIIDKSIAVIHQLARDGKLVKDVEEALIQLETKFVPLDDFTAAVKKFTDNGQLIPAIAKQLVDEYAEQKTEAGASDTAHKLLQQALQAAYAEIDQLEKNKKITTAVADQLRTMINQDVSLQEYEAVVGQMVQQSKLTPDIAKQKIADYRAVKGLRQLSNALASAQANNMSPSDYANILKQAVQDGLISPEDAARLFREYHALGGTNQGGPPPEAVTAQFANLQKELAAAGTVNAGNVSANQFETAGAEAQQLTDQERQARIQSLMGVMSGQAQQLIASWQPQAMQFKMGVSETQGRGQLGGVQGGQGRGGNNKGGQAPVGPVLIKAGSILFGVLETEVNSDYPDSPVMVTIVQGPYKGAKLLGKLATTKGVSGQQDRVSLNFTFMNTEEWSQSKPVTAFAIDPDTAKTVLASQVDYHYMQRFGAIMATSFIQGYANALQSSGATTSTSGFFTNTTNPTLSPSQKLAVAIGNIGTTLGSVTQIM